MAAEKVLIFKVKDSSALRMGIVKVIQGMSRHDFDFPKVVSSLPEEPASRLEMVAKVWEEIFPENPIAGLEIVEENSHLTVQGRVRSPVTKYRRGVYGIRHWMFVEEKTS